MAAVRSDVWSWLPDRPRHPALARQRRHVDAGVRAPQRRGRHLLGRARRRPASVVAIAHRSRRPRAAHRHRLRCPPPDLRQAAAIGSPSAPTGRTTDAPTACGMRSRRASRPRPALAPVHDGVRRHRCPSGHRGAARRPAPGPEPGRQRRSPSCRIAVSGCGWCRSTAAVSPAGSAQSCLLYRPAWSLDGDALWAFRITAERRQGRPGRPRHRAVRTAGERRPGQHPWAVAQPTRRSAPRALRPRRPLGPVRAASTAHRCAP